MLAVVSDGAGGHRGGSQASKLAVQTACEAFEKAGGNFVNPKAALLELCRRANEAILSLGETPKMAPKSTLAALYLDGEKAHMVHVGDSRIYRLRSGKMIARTRDHTMVQILLEQGEVREDEMGTHPDEGRLLRALGTDEELRPTYGVVELTGNDGFLLCSDGFWERTSVAEIEAFFQSGPEAQKLDVLVSRTIERNGPKGDNVTALAVSREGEGSRPNSTVVWKVIIGTVIVAMLLGAAVFLWLFPLWYGAANDDLVVPSIAEPSIHPQ